MTERRSRDRVYINKGWHHLFTRSETRPVVNSTSAAFFRRNGNRFGKIGFFWGSILRPVRLLQPARVSVPRRRQGEDQERDRAQHQPPFPRRTREEDRREISQQWDETQENQELVVVISFPRLRTGKQRVVWSCMCVLTRNGRTFIFPRSRPLWEKHLRKNTASRFLFAQPIDSVVPRQAVYSLQWKGANVWCSCLIKKNNNNNCNICVPLN